MLQSQIKQHSSCSLSLYDLMREDINCVEKIIHDEFGYDDLPILHSISEHIIGSGGKRIRPVLSLALGRILSPNEMVPKNIHMTAAALEYIHTATLLHDDVIDNGQSRRGKKTAHLIWGNQAAVLVGDHMFARAFCMLSGSTNFASIQAISNAAKLLAEGEILQLSFKHKIPDYDMHIKILGLKTASLFAAGCQAGVILSGGTDGQQQAAYQFGYAFGISFQLIDDILDYCGDDKLGKSVGSDFFEGKFTLPLILAYQSAEEQHKSMIEKMMFDSEQKTEKDFYKLVTVLKEYNALERSKQIAYDFIHQAIDSLEFFPQNDFRDALEMMVKDMLDRKK